MLDSCNPPQGTPQIPGSAIRTAVILAAGMGIRLNVQGRATPKGCICLGDRSIIEESVLRLLAVNIERIVIVTGHLAEQFEFLKEQYRQVQLVHNSHFADSGSMYSLYCARDWIDEDVLLLESDLVYERRALLACLDSPRENILLLAGFSNSSDEVFVETRNGQLVAMSKERSCLGAEIPGELVGISKISQTLFSVMIEKSEERFRATRHMDYESDCLVAAAKHVPVSCPLIRDLVWCEIDDSRHLARAENEIYPAVQAIDARDNGAPVKPGLHFDNPGANPRNTKTERLA